MSPFVHLHLHTEYSLLDGAARIKHLFSRCAELRQPAVAITDHGVMFGAVDFFLTAKKFNEKSDFKVKPIIGCEYYICGDRKERGKAGADYNHLVLLAKDLTGYRNLVKLDSLAFTEGFYYKPRIDFKLLKQYAEGIVCLSACLAGSVPQFLLNNDYENAKAEAKKFKDLFGDDYYIELQDHGIPEQRMILPGLIKIAKELNIKLVATNDVHYLQKEDAEMHNVLLCIQTGKKIDEPNGMRFPTEEFYLKSYDEMNDVLGYAEGALSNTLEIADKCNVEIPFKQNLIPDYKPEGITASALLRKLTAEGLAKRYSEVTDKIKQRAEYELGIIESMNFIEYFLIVWDFIDFAKKNNIPVGAGRGSGVGSIVAYSLEITDVDPLQFGLIFERFLNPERQSMPDFDIDFCYERRNEVIDYVVKKYGADRVAQIITFGTLAAKNAVKDVARVYNVPYSDSDKITKLISGLKITLPELLGRVKGKGEDGSELDKANREFIELYESDDTVKRVVDMAIKIEGMPRNTGMHAAGVVICKDVISDHVPLQKNSDGIVTTQFPMGQLEELGLLKMDFLALMTLTDIKKAKDYIREIHGKEIDFSKLGYNDTKVFEFIGSGATDAVFQLESAGMKSFMQRLRPENMEDVIAGISLYRPGPMDYIPQYVKNKHNPAGIKYDHPLLEPILSVTYGVAVYQEQVMEMVRTLAGYSLGRADNLRRIIGKKKIKDMIAEKEVFLNGLKDSQGNYKVDGVLRRGVSPEIAEKLWNDISAFVGYAFNKSHAAAYAVLAYETAYLKKYYTCEFLRAVLNNRIGKPDDIAKYLLHVKDIGIKVLPPDINKSVVQFGQEGNSLRFGLSAIKNVGENAVASIVAERKANGPFKNLEDFAARCDSSIINKRMLESMIKGGAFDCFGRPRAQLAYVYEIVLERTHSDKKATSDGQFTMFEKLPELNKIEYPPTKEYDSRQKLQFEKEMLGVYVTGHPLEDYHAEFAKFNFNTSMLMRAAENEELPDESIPSGLYDRQQVVLGGLLSKVERKMTRTNQTMGYASLEDYYGTVEVIFFPRDYARLKDLIIEDTIVRIEGTLQMRGGEPVKISVNNLKQLDIAASAPETVQADNKKVYINLLKPEWRRQIENVVSEHKGETPVILQIDKRLYALEDKGYWDNELYLLLCAIVGEKNIIVKENKQ